MYKTARFYLAVLVFSDNIRRMSGRDKNISHLGPVQTPYLSCAVPNTFSLLVRIKRQALPYPKILACLIEICRKKTHLDTVQLPKHYVLLGMVDER